MSTDDYLNFIKLNLRDLAQTQSGFNPILPKNTELLSKTSNLRQELFIFLKQFNKQMIDPKDLLERKSKSIPPKIFNQGQLFYLIEYFPEYAKIHWNDTIL